MIGTCKNYLLLIKTEHKSKPGTLGFQKSMSEADKPTPVRLQLRPEHVAWMQCQINFTTARFNTGDKQEKSIITSTGPFVVTWNFAKVKAGKLYDYTIKHYDETVVSDNFIYGADKNIICVLPSNVEMIRKSTLQTPTRLLKSRSSIVNSPY